MKAQAYFRKIVSVKKASTAYKYVDESQNDDDLTYREKTALFGVFYAIFHNSAPDYFYSIGECWIYD